MSDHPIDSTIDPSSVDVVSPMVERSQQAFLRDLPELLGTHPRQWVAYHGDQRVGFGDNETELYLVCFRRGLKQEEFIVCGIEPAIENVFGLGGCE